MNLYFDKRLRQEKILIAVMLTVFTVAYLSRAAVYFITQVCFQDMDPFREIMIFYVSYLIWDVIPLTVIMRFHSKKIKRPLAKQSHST